MFESIRNKFQSKENNEDDKNMLNDPRESNSSTTPVTANIPKSKTIGGKSNNDLAPPSDVNIETASAPSAVEEQQLNPDPVAEEDLKFYQGGVRKKHKPFVKWIGRIGFIAKGVVYGCIGVLTLTNLSGAWTPNGSQGNESPQGAFLLLGGIPSIGRSILIVMAVGLCLYIIWRMWEAITGQGSDASFSKKKNFFRYRLSPFVSGLVYTAYCYYVIQMIFQTEEEQQAAASSKTFPASWSKTTLGKAGIGILGVAFLIAFFTQIINAVTGNFINDLKTSGPGARKWEAFIIHTMGRIGFGGRAALFGTMSGFFWDSLAKQNESGDKNMVAAAVGKLANSGGGRFFMGLLGVSLVIYAVFAVLNAYYKYFPTPPPQSRREFYTNDLVRPEESDSDSSSDRSENASRRSIEHARPNKQQGEDLVNEKDTHNNEEKPSFLARYLPFMRRSKKEHDPEKAEATTSTSN